MSTTAKAALCLCAILPLAACQTPSGPSYTGSTPVRAPCGGQYMVGTKPNSTTLLVSPYVITTPVQAICESREGAAPTRTGVAFEAGARAYLTEKMKKPECEIVSGTSLTVLHSEFTYRCP